MLDYNPGNMLYWGASKAIAAATGTAKTPQAVECEASQSGPKGIAHPQGDSA